MTCQGSLVSSSLEFIRTDAGLQGLSSAESVNAYGTDEHPGVGGGDPHAAAVDLADAAAMREPE